MRAALHYSASLDALLDPRRLGRWTRPDCLFEAMRQLQSLSMVDVALCDVLGPDAPVPWPGGTSSAPQAYTAQWPDVLGPLGDDESRALLRALDEMPKDGELMTTTKFGHGALLVPWIQRAGSLERVGDFPLGGVWAMPLGALYELCESRERADRMIQLSARTKVPIAIAPS
jgi:hypothetical protein